MNFAGFLILTILLVGCSYRTGDIFDDPIEKERLLKLANNYQELIGIYRDRLASSGADTDRLKLIELYYDIGDYNSADYFLGTLLQKDSIDALFLKARVLEARRLYPQALTTIERVLLIDPKLAKAWNLRGVISARSGDYEGSKKAFFTAKGLYFDDCIVNTNLGALEVLRRNYRGAIDYFAPLYARGCKNDYLVNNYIFALTKNSDYELAQKVIEDERVTRFPRKFMSALRKAIPNAKSAKK